MPDFTFKIFSLIDNKKIESAASPELKMKQIISPVHRLTLIKKTRRRVRFAAWLKGAMLLAMLPQSVSAIVLGPGYQSLVTGTLRWSRRRMVETSLVLRVVVESIFGITQIL